MTVVIMLASALSAGSLACLSDSDIADFTFEQFRNCKAVKEADVAVCVGKFTSPRLTQPTTQKLAKWLLDLDQIGDLGHCPQETLNLFPQASNPAYKLVKCFSFSARGNDGTALVYFAEDAGEMAIEGLQFL